MKKFFSEFLNSKHIVALCEESSVSEKFLMVMKSVLDSLSNLITALENLSEKNEVAPEWLSGYLRSKIYLKNSQVGKKSR